MYELECRFDSRKSFYGKAKVVIQTNKGCLEKGLMSYYTLVAKVIESGMMKKYIYNGYYSSTTTRHQKEFFLQEGLTDKEIKKLFKEGSLIKENEKY